MTDQRIETEKHVKYLEECECSSDQFNTADIRFLLQHIDTLEKELSDMKDYTKGVWKRAHDQYKFDLEMETAKLTATVERYRTALEYYINDCSCKRGGSCNCLVAKEALKENQKGESR